LTHSATPDVARHTRQARLAAVGVERQRKLASREARVQACGFAGEIEARYLAGAGVGALTVKDDAHARAAVAVDPSVRIEIAQNAPESSEQSVSPLPPILVALDPAARELAEGAFRALQTLRSLLAAS
jgi:hypothetical protein